MGPVFNTETENLLLKTEVSKPHCYPEGNSEVLLQLLCSEFEVY